MTYGGSPWADPTTPTQPGSPYFGPPPTAPAPQYGYPGPYGYAVLAHPGYGYPGPWGPVPPLGPQRPAQVITSAVLAFVQSGIVLIASLYLWFFASVLDLAVQDGAAPFPSSSRIDALTTEGTALAVVQLVSVVVLVVAGVRALSARGRAAWFLLIGAHAVQIVLVLYWAVRLVTFVTQFPGNGPPGALASFTIVFAAAPLVGLGVLLTGAGRRWFESPPHP